MGHSSGVEVNQRPRRAKTDKLEIRKLLTMLMRYDSGERKLWSVVRASDRSGTRLCGSVGDRAFGGWSADTRGVQGRLTRIGIVALVRKLFQVRLFMGRSSGIMT